MSVRLAAAFATIVLSATAANAADCTLRMAADVALTEGADDTLLVPVQLNGTTHLMKLDIQAAYSAISRAVADQLSLTRKSLPEGISVDLNGEVVTQSASIPTLQIGNAKGADFKSLVSPSLHEVDPRIDGVLGMDILASFDVDLDLAHDRMRLFSQDHCPGKVVYWSSSSAVASVPLDFQRSGNIVIDMTLDGKPVHAGLKTDGPSTSSLGALHRIFDLDEASPGMKVAADVHSNAEPSLTYYRYPFQALLLSGIAIGHPDILIDSTKEECRTSMRLKPDDPRDSGRSGVTTYRCFGGADLFVGRSVLSKLHLYFAFKEKMLYATAADDSAPAPVAAAAPGDRQQH